ncbi:hypothetical protein PHET_03815 [Paragonimus heterotremus]|uniref:Uncharacterized protein n=1 Tax=Paragonimus heterotremus TaxID=100268 RepID=A0A8J4WJ47_9TREM|nr:hypothetical protein PHET_03815 [Paragonimus heterotremus]
MSQINERGAIPGWTRVDPKKHLDGSDHRSQTMKEDHSSHQRKDNPNMQPTQSNASQQPNVTARFTINSPVASLRRSPTNPYHGSSTFVVVANQKAKSEPGVWEKPPISAPQRASDAQFEGHQKRRTHVHEQVKQFREEIRNSTKVSKENARLSKHVSSYEERRASTWEEKRRTSGKSLENMAAMSTTPLGHYHKHRSMSPTKKSSQSTQGKGSFSHKKTLSLMADGLTARLWDGNTVLLKPSGNQTLGELLRPYMKNVHKPMECVDSITERVLSWNTRAKDLNRRGVNIREIGSLVTRANTPVTTSTKKLEKRGSATGVRGCLLVFS